MERERRAHQVDVQTGPERANLEPVEGRRSIGPRRAGGGLGRDDGGGAAASGAFSAAINAGLRGGGNALPAALRSRFEGSLGTDLGGVRVHDGDGAARASAAVGARAFAVGQDVYMGAGQYQPDTDDGAMLLAHEVAHTVQQRGAVATPQTKLTVTESGDACEAEADTAAQAMVAGRPATVAAAPMAIARTPQSPPPAAPPPAVAAGTRDAPRVVPIAEITEATRIGNSATTRAGASGDTWRVVIGGRAYVWKPENNQQMHFPAQAGMAPGDRARRGAAYSDLSDHLGVRTPRTEVVRIVGTNGVSGVPAGLGQLQVFEEATNFGTHDVHHPLPQGQHSRLRWRNEWSSLVRSQQDLDAVDYIAGAMDNHEQNALVRNGQLSAIDRDVSFPAGPGRYSGVRPTDVDPYVRAGGQNYGHISRYQRPIPQTISRALADRLRETLANPEPLRERLRANLAPAEVEGGITRLREVVASIDARRTQIIEPGGGTPPRPPPGSAPPSGPGRPPSTGGTEPGAQGRPATAPAAEPATPARPSARAPSAPEPAAQGRPPSAPAAEPARPSARTPSVGPAAAEPAAPARPPSTAEPEAPGRRPATAVAEPEPSTPRPHARIALHMAAAHIQNLIVSWMYDHMLRSLQQITVPAGDARALLQAAGRRQQLGVLEMVAANIPSYLQQFRQARWQFGTDLVARSLAADRIADQNERVTEFNNLELDVSDDEMTLTTILQNVRNALGLAPQYTQRATAARSLQRILESGPTIAFMTHLGTDVEHLVQATDNVIHFAASHEVTVHALQDLERAVTAASDEDQRMFQRLDAARLRGHLAPSGQ